MRKILLLLEYDGTHFAGWQYQTDKRTLQGEMERVLREMLQEPNLRLNASGRTDAGVHALGMPAAFLTQKTIPLENLVLGLNAQLPHDIAVLQAREIPINFCPRHRSKGKRYRYRVWNHPLRSALLRDHSWHIYTPLDIEAMREGASHLLGRHDFSAFQASGCAASHPIRDIHNIRIYREGHAIFFEFDGTAFLRHMVRNLVGTLVMIGKGQREPAWVKEVIASRDRRKGGKTAPAGGLYLVCVHYQLPPGPTYPPTPEINEENDS